MPTNRGEAYEGRIGRSRPDNLHQRAEDAGRTRLMREDLPCPGSLLERMEGPSRSQTAGAVCKAATGTWLRFALVLAAFRAGMVGWLKSKLDGAAFKALMGGWSPFHRAVEVLWVLTAEWRQSLPGPAGSKGRMAEW